MVITNYKNFCCRTETIHKYTELGMIWHQFLIEWGFKNEKRTSDLTNTFTIWLKTVPLTCKSRKASHKGNHWCLWSWTYFRSLILPGRLLTPELTSSFYSCMAFCCMCTHILLGTTANSMAVVNKYVTVQRQDASTFSTLSLGLPTCLWKDADSNAVRDTMRCWDVHPPRFVCNPFSTPAFR